MASSRHPQAAPAYGAIVQICTLGQFSVAVRGVPLLVDSRSVRRPLELLQCLIAHGGIGVPEAQLSEALWPDADGDHAHRAFATTLHRLRRLLGSDVLPLKLGRLSLDLDRCWVDALVFLGGQNAFTDASDVALKSLEGLLSLYGGPFLDGATESVPVVGMREQLRSLYVQRALKLGRLLEDLARRDEAAEAYERALAVEPAAESVCHALMASYCANGRPAEAISAYRRHRRYAANLGAPASPILEDQLRLALETRAPERILPEAPTLAVLPFTFLGRAPGQHWLAEAFTENLAAHLARLPRLVAIDLHSTRVYAQGNQRIRRIGEELGASYVLRGSVQIATGRLRVTATLVDTRSEESMWAEQYDGSLDDPVALQDRIVAEILTSLQVQLTEGEQARLLWRGTTHSLRAWELAVRGLDQYRRYTTEGHAEARRLWIAALELDPDYVMALVPLGWTYVSDVRRGRTRHPAQALARAESLARRALALDPHSGPAHVLLGTVRVDQRRHDEGRTLLLQAAELNPHGADTAAIVGSGLSYCGEPQAGAQRVRRAMQLSPFYPEWYLGLLGCALYLAGDFTAALRALQRSRVVQAGELGMALTAACQVALQSPVDGRETVLRLLRAFPGFTLRRRLHRMFPVRDPAWRAKLAKRLRVAGCP